MAATIDEAQVFVPEPDLWGLHTPDRRKLYTDDVEADLEYRDYSKERVKDESIQTQAPSSMRTLNRLFRALQLLKDSVEIDPERRGGYPVLAGTRFKASQLLAQIAEGDSIDDLEENLGLDRDVMQQFLRALSICLDRQWTTPDAP